MVDDDAFDSDYDYSPKHNTGRPPPSDDYDEDVNDEIDEDDDDGDGELSLELGCPFCSEDYDALGLCLHIQDQHLIETKSGVCPICATNAGINMVSHLIIQHESMLKTLRKLKRRDESYSIMSLLRKKLLDEHQRSRKESSAAVSSINVAPDRLLLSFINNPPHDQKPEAVLLKPSTGASVSAKTSDEITLERCIPTQPLSHTDQGEKANKSEFVRTLLFSTIFHDDL